MLHRLILLGLALSALLRPNAAQAADVEAPRCFDALVVASIERAVPTPVPAHPPDVIVMRWPWRVDIDVEHALIGDIRTGRRTVSWSLHTDFNPRIEHVLLFLRRQENGSYSVDGWRHDVVRDRNGRFVLPMARPLHPSALFPSGWIPQDYELRLRSVRYRGRDAWWLGPPYLSDAATGELDGVWAVRSGRALVARRGLFLADLADALGRLPGAVCTTAAQAR